jgi:pimeloyl-ACP methyl ester carboxylesterase
MIAAERGSYVEVDGLRTYYLRVGGGPPVVLIHGASPGACSLVAWPRNLEPLAAAGFTVYAFEQPGFGYTDNPVDHSIEYRVAHARAFLDTLGLERFHLVGNSVGGYIAARIALDDPRVERLVSTTSGTLAPRGSAHSQAQSQQHSDDLAGYEPSLANMRALTEVTLFDQALATDELVRLRYGLSIDKNYEAQRARVEAPRPRRLDDELPRLRVPTLLLWGRNDAGVSVERGLLLFERIPGAEFHLFDCCGHWVQSDQAARFNAVVADFLGAAPGNKP